MTLGSLLNFLCFSKEISIVTEAKKHIGELKIFWEDVKSIWNVSIYQQKQHKFQAELPRDLNPLWGMGQGKAKN